MIKLRDLLIERAYKYVGSDGYWSYIDGESNVIIVEIFEDPQFNRLELETYVETGSGKKYSGYSTKTKNRGNRGETTKVIFEKEVIPYFKKQTEFNDLCLQPIDERRDKFFQEMVKQFEKGNYKIVKMIPGLIIIRKLYAKNL